MKPLEQRVRAAPTKTRLGMLFSCLLFVSVLIVIILGFQRRQQDPVYRGKRLSAWLADLDLRAPSDVREKAREAVWTLGTNALGPLPPMLRARDFLPERTLINLNKFGVTQSPVRFHITMAVDLHAQALAAYGLLNQLASPDVPLLTKMLTQEKSREVRLQAARALPCIHPVGTEAAMALTSLTEATRDPDAEVRSSSLLALLVISQDRGLLVPVLIERLADPFAPTVELAKNGLVGIGAPAIPSLRASCQTNQIAGQVLQQMRERKLHPDGQPRVRYL